MSMVENPASLFSSVTTRRERDRERHQRERVKQNSATGTTLRCMITRMRCALASGALVILVAMSVLSGCKSNHGASEGTGGAGPGAAGGDPGALPDGGTAATGGTVGATGGAGGGAAVDPCTSAIFCDDFEKYAAGAAPTSPWRSQMNMGTVSVDATQSHSGGKSVKFTTLARTTDGIKTAFMELSGAPVFPISGNVMYGRMMFRLEAAPTTSVHWTLIQGAGIVTGASYHALYRYGGQLPVTQGATFVGSQLMANYDTPDSYSGTPPASDCWQHADKVVVPVGRWACVEWKFDGPNNQMTLSMDGVPVPSLTVNGAGQGCVNQPGPPAPPFPWSAPTFDRLDLGWESYQIDGARAINIDDVVVSRTPIGCPP
jgi:hypothetical protein